MIRERTSQNPRNGFKATRKPRRGENEQYDSTILFSSKFIFLIMGHLTNHLENSSKEKRLNRTRSKPEFRASCSWVLFGRGTFELAWIWVRTEWNLTWHMNTTSRYLNLARMKFVLRIDFTVHWFTVLSNKLLEIWGCRKKTSHSNERNQWGFRGKSLIF